MSQYQGVTKNNNKKAGAVGKTTGRSEGRADGKINQGQGLKRRWGRRGGGGRQREETGVGRTG